MLTLPLPASEGVITARREGRRMHYTWAAPPAPHGDARGIRYRHTLALTAHPLPL